jgi:hypothetical protein
MHHKGKSDGLWPSGMEALNSLFKGKLRNCKGKGWALQEGIGCLTGVIDKVLL